MRRECAKAIMRSLLTNEGRCLMSSAITPRYLRSKDAAQYCGFADASFRTYRTRGGGPKFIKHGRTVLYDVKDLDAWVGDMRVGSTSEVGA